MTVKNISLRSLLGVAAVLAALAAVAAEIARNPDQTLAAERLKKIHQGFGMYMWDYDDRFPLHSSVGEPKYRWMDVTLPYVEDAHAYIAPGAPAHLLTRQLTWHEDFDLRVGGFGFNYQYLGNSRNPNPSAPSLPFSAAIADLSEPGKTILIGDTQGARDAIGRHVGVYVLDPPLGSERGSGNGLFYEGSLWMHRSAPAYRHEQKATILFCDGRIELMSPVELDDADKNGQPDNGWWNGHFDVTRRR
jgi:prepilin-type processing-associated H-X9-DG protein